MDGEDLSKYDANDKEDKNERNDEDKEALERLEWELASDTGRITGEQIKG